MTEWELAISALPPPLFEQLRTLPFTVCNTVQEIRLRKNCPLTLVTPQECIAIKEIYCKAEMLFSVFQALCEYSVHTHQEEIRQGYIQLKNGCRAGVAGTAVLENGKVYSLREVTSVCVRIYREHKNCAKDICFTLMGEGRLHSALICGEPASGKSSILRDLIRHFSSDRRPFSVAVVDERGELCPKDAVACDVLRGYPKAVGIEQALRTLAPNGVVFDELGSEAELMAVEQCLHSGVAAFTSVHATADTLGKRPVVRHAIQSGVFEYLVLLKGRREPGRIEKIIPIEEVSL